MRKFILGISVAPFRKVKYFLTKYCNAFIETKGGIYAEENKAKMGHAKTNCAGEGEQSRSGARSLQKWHVGTFMGTCHSGTLYKIVCPLLTRPRSVEGEASCPAPLATNSNRIRDPRQDYH